MDQVFRGKVVIALPEEADADTAVIHIAPGETLHQRWRVEARVGQGAMGSVFRGRDLESQQTVAIKILAPAHCRKAKVVARFEREAKQMTALRHPNIVAFFGHGRHGVLPFIVMEFLEGQTLFDSLKQRGGRLSPRDAVGVIKEIGEGLSFLHQSGLVHRDIKPQNIFLRSDGRVTILDLGVVRDQKNPGFTRPGAMVGTPYYMSPEQIVGVSIDERTDVYALSALTFEILTGRPPFTGKSNFEVLYGHKNTPPPDASALNPAVPHAMSAVLVQGLAKERDKRIQSVADFVRALAAAEESALDVDASADGQTGQVNVVVTADKRIVAPVLSVDGNRVKAPSGDLTLGVGPHRLLIELEGFRSVERWVDVSAGALICLRIYLERK